MTERAFQKKVLKYLETRGGWWYKTPATVYSKAGTPDIIGCYRGRFVAIELKRPGIRYPWQALSELQEMVMQEILDQGGAYLAANQLKPIVKFMEELDAVIGPR